jgi:large subunit ribosomal protein L25
MRRVELDVDVRRDVGKGVARTLRRQGRLPAVLYHAGTSLLLSVDDKAVEKLFHTGAGEHVLITVKIHDGAEHRSCVAVVRDSQRDPITDRILHVDLFEISLDKPLRVAVPVHVMGDVPAGVKEGGVMHHHLRQVEVECLPLAVPDELQIDASSLQINQSLHVSDLVVDPAIRMMTPGDQMVVSIAAPMSEAKLEQLLTATAKETKEPELLKKAKEEEEAAVEGGAAAKPAPVKEEKEAKEEKKESKAK